MLVVFSEISPHLRETLNIFIVSNQIIPVNHSEKSLSFLFFFFLNFGHFFSPSVKSTHLKLSSSKNGEMMSEVMQNRIVCESMGDDSWYVWLGALLSWCCWETGCSSPSFLPLQRIAHSSPKAVLQLLQRVSAAPTCDITVIHLICAWMPLSTSVSRDVVAHSFFADGNNCFWHWHS